MRWINVSSTPNSTQNYVIYTLISTQIYARSTLNSAQNYVISTLKTENYVRVAVDKLNLCKIYAWA